jgi:type IV secretion system protein VirB4
MMEVIPAAMSAVGATAVGLLYTRLKQSAPTSSLKKYRHGGPGLADLLIYAAAVDDGIVVGKNGSLMTSWRYKGDDNASSTDAQREAASVRKNQALARLGNGWMIHVDAARHPAPDYPDARSSHFPDEVSAALDEERRRTFQHLGQMYDGYYVLTLTYLPPLLVQNKLVELMFDDEANESDKRHLTLRLIEFFKQECANIELRLSSVLRMERLRANRELCETGELATYDRMLAWLNYCITGNGHPIRLPQNPMYLDALIGGQELHTGVVPRIGKKFLQVVAIEGFPLESSPGMLTLLGELECEYRWSTRFIFMDTHEAASHLEKFRKKWRQKIRGFFDQVFNTSLGPVDQDAVSMVADAEQAIADVNSGQVAEGYYTSVVVLFDEDREKLAASARLVEKTINRLGFTARIETINTMDAFLGSLPGHGVENVRRPLINTMNLADLLPTSSIWTGAPNAPCPLYPPLSPPLMHCVTQGATPFRLNLHVRDLGHTLMFGPTRSGKSTHLGMIVAQLRRYPRMQIFMFDKGMSIYPLTKAVGGKHFVVASDDDRLAFCPLQYLETKGDRAWAMEWIDTILALNNVVTTPSQRNEIASAIVNMHASGARTLSEFSVTIQDEAIREALRQYTVDGAMGQLLDADDDGLSLSDFTVFEIEELMGLGEKYALPVLLYLFRRIERSLQGQPAAIFLDEAWLMLGHPTFRMKIRTWLKTLAKLDCLVFMATQNISDAANSGILDVIVESTATKIFLPNIYAQDEETSALYRRMGLNNRQIEILASAIPKRHYYYVSECGRRLYELNLGPLALSLVGSTDKESIATIRALEDKHGDQWIHEWLANWNLRLDDYKVKS